jgi:hypothetical protein
MSWFPLFFVLFAGQTVEDCCSATIGVRTAEGLAIPGAVVRIESGAMRYSGSAAENGEAVFVLRTPGQYLATASAKGYAPQSRQFSVARDEKARVELVLVRHESVTVEGQAAPLDVPWVRRELHFWLSDDARRLPLAALGSIDLGTVRATLTSFSRPGDKRQDAEPKRNLTW